MSASKIMNIVLQDNAPWQNLTDKDGNNAERSPESVELLKKYSDKKLSDWDNCGVCVFGHTNDNADESKNSTVFSLSPTAEGNDNPQKIQTHNIVGVVRLHDRDSQTRVQLSIGSRFDKKGDKPFFLTYLLSKVFGGNFVDSVEIAKDDLWDLLLGLVFCRKLMDASSVGLFKQYQTRHYNDSRLKGCIEVARHLRENIPYRGTVAYRTHEHTFDNPINHLIRHALRKIETKGWGWMFARHPDFHAIKRLLQESTPTWYPQELKSCLQSKEVRQPVRHPFFAFHYEPLRTLALSLLADEGASLYCSQQEAEGVLFDAAWLWEEYLWTLLRPLGFKHPQNKTGSGGWKPLDGVTFYPDFYYLDEANRIILDAKYQKENNDENKRLESVRQVFAYMFLADANHGGLIKPDGACAKECIEIKKPEPKLKNGYHPSCLWWELSLTPPEQDEKLNAGQFCKGMKEKEDAFCEQVKAIKSSNSRTEQPESQIV